MNTTNINQLLAPIMAESPPSSPKQADIEKLTQMMEAVLQSDRQLQSSYEKLHKEKEQVKNYLNEILESLTTGVIVVDQEDRITVFNKMAGVITGRSPQDAIGKKLKQALNTDLFESMLQRLTQSGNRTMSLDQVFTNEDGRKINIRVSVSPMLDHNDQQTGTVIVVQDITQLKHLEEEVQRNSRLKATGEMAAGIAHEIRNPLGSIELFASLLKKDLDGDAEKKELVEHICSGVKNMDRIISSLLLFAQSPQPSRQKCDVNALLDKLLESKTALNTPENIRIIRQFSDEHPTGKGDSELLKQVFSNLIRNAIQAMPQGGELRLQTEKTVEAPAADDPLQDKRQYIAITLSDTGVGISPENLGAIFNPFFTTKEKGTGLGLSIAHNIIKAHQGTLDVESTEGKGTTFIVKIPCWNEDYNEK